jgi:hypothetical protein
MKGTFMLFILLLWANSSLFSQQADSVSNERSYFLKDYQYFKPMLANIRSPQFHMRLYRDEAVKFSNSTLSGEHTFWDVGFGGFFSMFGFAFNDRPVAHIMERTGIDFFLDASAHMLLDFNTLSSDVINTDFRLGGGIAMRLPHKLKNLSLLSKFFHESTHIGDEYTLAAAIDTSFHRYNVSYEAVELYLAGDHYRAARTTLVPEYFRLYAGSRLLTKPAKFEDFSDEQQSLAKALKTSDRWEFQLGAEAFLHGWLPASAPERQKDGWLRKLLLPQFLVAASDFYHRDKYDVVLPQKIWSTNLAFGAIYGDYFQGKRTTQWLINYYRGVNPHGQFRADEIRYWGFDVKVGL